MPDQYATEINFKGMNATRSPEALGPGELQLLIDGAIVENQQGQAGGVIQTRPGKRAQLTSALPGKVTYQKVFQDATGVQHTICAVTSSPTATTGYLYDWVKGATTATQLTSLGLFNSYLVQIALLSTYAYIVGATDGLLRRTDLVSTFAVASSPISPTTAPTVNLTSWSSDTNNIASAWATDTLNSAPDVVNGGFSSGSAYYSTSVTGWDVPTGSVQWLNNAGVIANLTPPPGSSRYSGIIPDTIGYRGAVITQPTFAQIDDAASYFISHDYIVNATLSNANNTFGQENGTGTGTTRRASHFLFTCAYITSSGGFNDSFDATVFFFDASHNPTVQQTVTFTPQQVGTVVALGAMFSFAGVDPTELVFYKLACGNPGTAVRTTGGAGPYISQVSCVPYEPQVTFSNDGTQQVGINGITRFSNQPLRPLDTNIADQSVIFWGGMRYSHVFSAAIDFTKYTTINIPLTLNITPANGLSATLNFKADAAHAGIRSNPLMLLQSSSGQVYFQTDVSALTPTNGFGTNLNSIGVVELIFTVDTPLATGTVVPDKPLVLSALGFPGNLSIDLDYSLRFTEATSNDPATRLESGGSPLSAEFVPDGLNATYVATIPAPVNASGPDMANFYGIYRQGGTFPDPYFRLESVLPLATGITTIPNLTWNSGTGTYTGTSAISGLADFTWNPTTRVYTSNVPDSDLSLAAFLFDHDATPTGAQTIEVYQNRLLLTVGNQLYISALTTGISAGLYYSNAPDPNNPNYEIQGNLIPIGGQEGTTLGQTIRRLYAYRGRCLIMFETSTYVLQGINNTNFSVYQDAAIRGVGIIAPNAIALVDNRLWFLTNQGLISYDYQSLNQDLAYPIGKLLNPNGMAFGQALNASAYAKANMLSNAGRLFLSVPSGTSTLVNTTYVCDVRNGGNWAIWNCGEVLSGESFDGAIDQNELILGDGAGMISSVQGGVFGDTATAAGSVSPVTLQAKLRPMVDEQFSLEALTSTGTVDVQDASDTFNLTCSGPNGITASVALPLTVGDDVFVPGHGAPFRWPSYVRGRYLVLSFAVTSTLPVVVRRLVLKATKSFRI